MLLCFPEERIEDLLRDALGLMPTPTSSSSFRQLELQVADFRILILNYKKK